MSKITGSAPVIGARSFSAIEAELRAIDEEEHRTAPPGAFTVSGYSAATGCGRTASASRIRKLINKGRAKHIGKFRATDAAGRPQFVEHYQLTQPAKK